MKMKTRCGIPAFALVFVMALTVGLVLAACDILDGSPPSGTPSGAYFSTWETYQSMTFSGNSVIFRDTLRYRVEITGTYTVSGNTVTMTFQDNLPHILQLLNFEIVNPTTLRRDTYGDLWIKR